MLATFMTNTVAEIAFEPGWCIAVTRPAERRSPSQSVPMTSFGRVRVEICFPSRVADFGITVLSSPANMLANLATEATMELRAKSTNLHCEPQAPRAVPGLSK